MCGIAASFAYHPRAPLLDRVSIERACDRMACRGPDGFGVWVDPSGRVALGHRRLSIIDLSERGRQPMISNDGKLTISFNGEIYNYKALRKELEQKGYEFRSDSDTEVLLQLYAERGEGMLRFLRGMFAFALWDAGRQRLLLARDPFGIKPLYYADDGQTIRAASEVKSLLEFGNIDREPDAAGHVGFFLWGHVPEPHTLYRGIKTLPAGNTLSIGRDGERTAKEYANVASLLAEDEGAPVTQAGEAVEQLSEALRDSVRQHLVADVDVGVFLSAGRDSTTLAALAAEMKGRLRTVTLGFEEYRDTPNDETPIAEAVARQYGAEHQTVWISRREFEESLPKILDRMDQPTIDGVNSFFVARAASEAGLKVALSGLGGDELLGGYDSFLQIPRLVSVIQRVPAREAIGRGVRRMISPVVGSFTSPKYAGLLEYGGDIAGAYLLRRGLFLPWELTRVFDTEFVNAGLRELRTLGRLRDTISHLTSDRFRISALESAWYMRNQLLRDTDWASMSHSLEVRVPLVDWPLWRTVARLVRLCPSLDKSSMVRSPAQALPLEVVQRAKTGFTTPAGRWLAQRNDSFAERGLRGWARYVHRAAQGLAA